MGMTPESEAPASRLRRKRAIWGFALLFALLLVALAVGVWCGHVPAAPPEPPPGAQEPAPYNGVLERRGKLVRLNELELPVSLPSWSEFVAALRPHWDAPEVMLSGYWLRPHGRKLPFSVELGTQGRFLLVLGDATFHGMLNRQTETLELSFSGALGDFPMLDTFVFPPALASFPASAKGQFTLSIENDGRIRHFNALAMELTDEWRPSPDLPFFAEKTFSFHLREDVWTLDLPRVRGALSGSISLRGDKHSKRVRADAQLALPFSPGLTPFQGEGAEGKWALEHTGTLSHLAFGDGRVDARDLRGTWKISGGKIRGDWAGPFRRMEFPAYELRLAGGRVELACERDFATEKWTANAKVTNTQFSIGEYFSSEENTLSIQIDGSLSVNFSAAKGALDALHFQRGGGSFRWNTTNAPPVCTLKLEDVEGAMPGGVFSAATLTMHGPASARVGEAGKTIYRCGEWEFSATGAELKEGGILMKDAAWRGKYQNGTAAFFACMPEEWTFRGLRGASPDGNSFEAEELAFGPSRLRLRGGRWTDDGMVFNGIDANLDAGKGTLLAREVKGAGPLLESFRATLEGTPEALRFRGNASAACFDGTGIYFTGDFGADTARLRPKIEFKLPLVRLARPLALDALAALPLRVSVEGSIEGEGVILPGEGTGGWFRFREAGLSGEGVQSGKPTLELVRTLSPSGMRLSVHAPLLEIAGMTLNHGNLEFVREGNAPWRLHSGSDRGLLGMRHAEEVADGFMLYVTGYPASEVYRELGIADASISGALSGTLHYKLDAGRLRLDRVALEGSRLRLAGALPGNLGENPNSPFIAALLKDFQAERLVLRGNRETLVMELDGAPASPIPFRAGQNGVFSPVAPDVAGFDQALELKLRFHLSAL